MTAILTNEGQKEQQDTLITNVAAGLRLGLYTARSTYSKATVLADITACTFSGYAVQTPVFSVVGVDGNGRYEMDAPQYTYTHNGGVTANTVLGYYIFNNATGKLYYLEDFGAPVTMSSNGQNIKITPQWFYGDLTPPL